MTNPSPENTRYVLPETVALAVLGCLDLLTTVYWIATNAAHEANPIAAQILQSGGPLGFVLFKALLIGLPLVVAETARRRNPKFVRSALRMGVILYVGLYLIAFARSNAAHLLGY